MTYDPVPDLAALIDGTYKMARSGGDPAVLGRLLTGPYARLSGGLLISWPGQEYLSTEQALRAALADAGYRKEESTTRTGDST